jgi:hypothetical protein
VVVADGASHSGSTRSAIRTVPFSRT